MSSKIPVDRYRLRLGAAQDELEDNDARALLIGYGTDLRWLTGYAAMPSERLTMLVVTEDRQPTLVVPRLEQAAALAGGAPAAGITKLLTWTETENPIELVVEELANAHGTGELLASDWLPAMFVTRLQAALPGARFGLASRVLSPLRQIKDADEVAMLRAAAEAADRTVARIFAGQLVGRKEADVAAEVRTILVEEGHETADFAIVASGPNSASPHHEASDRVIRAGEPIVLDIGGSIGGYHSDITRTCWVTGGDTNAGPEDEYGRLFAILEEAQSAGREEAAPGVACEAVDAAARGVIDRGGYGEHFIHRTGHGTGLDGHEDPYIVAGNTAPLVPGNVYSVEPGIYLDGRYGARIEDICVCTENGSESLNHAPRSLAVISGVA
jgi:Xaa-Pro aminopeptidase